MITSYKIYESYYARHNEYPNVKVGDYVLVSSDDADIGRGVGVWGDPAKITDFTYTEDPDAPGSFTITAYIMTQDRHVTAYDYEIDNIISKDEAEMLAEEGYKFEEGEVVYYCGWCRDTGKELKFWEIQRRRFKYANGEWKTKYLVYDWKGQEMTWVEEYMIEHLTDEQREEYEMLKMGKKYNI